MSRLIACGFALLFAGLAAAPDPVKPDFESPRPIEAHDSLFLEELTWMEIRDAQKAGKTTIIVATGGMEQNGPYLAAGKHNYVLKGATAAIAHKLGNALIAPIIAFVPEGDIDPPSLHMHYPGSISLREDTYRALLTDICDSLRVTGFKEIVLIGDSGGNQQGMDEVAQALNAKWGGKPARVHYIREFYNYDKLGPWLEEQGIKQTPEGYHDDFGMTAMIISVDPLAVRAPQRIKAGKFTINGVNLAPMEQTIAWGKKIIDYRANVAVTAIRAAIEK